MESNNVIDFPKLNYRIGNIRKHIEEIKQEKLQNDDPNLKLDPVETIFISDAIQASIIDIIASSGYDIYDQDSIKDLALLLESIKSYVFKKNGYPYPVQLISDELFVVKNDGYNDGVLFIQGKFIEKVLSMKDKNPVTEPVIRSKKKRVLKPKE